MNAHKITIIDYGVGNLLSVYRGFEYCGAEVVITNDPKKILSSSRIVLPGVGAFPNGMKALNSLKLIDSLKEIAHRDLPLLGICLGMQLLLDEGEEFEISKGLGLIPGRVVPIPHQTIHGVKHKIPYIGWSSIVSNNSWKNTLLHENKEREYFYFVHSFMGLPLKSENIIANYEYGGHQIPAMIQMGNVIGCQFHPEKSGEAGLKILKRFCVGQ